MKHWIHMTDEERATQEMAEAIKEMNTKTQGNPELVDALDKNTRKLEEVKSASLATNIILKQIKEKTPTSFKAEKVEFNGAEVVTLQGRTGPRGEKGDTGAPGRDGKDSKDGMSITGPAGKDGKDALPESPDEIVGKINSSKKKIKASQIIGLADALDSIDQIVKSPSLFAGGNNKQGTAIYDEDLSAGGTLSGTSFTLSHQPITGTVRLHRAGSRQLPGSGNDYTISSSTITLTNSLAVGEILTCDYSRY